MVKAFKLGFIIGRFQHLHVGHQKMIKAGLDTCDRVLLLVGSSQESFTERNPFTLKTRMDVIRDVYEHEVECGRLLLGHIDDMTHENDHSKEWGDYVLQKLDMWTQHYSLSNPVDCMIYGNDEGRMNWFRSESVGHMSQIILGRPDSEISATKMRQFVIEGNFDEWTKFMPEFLDDYYWFERFREELSYSPYYKEMVNNV